MSECGIKEISYRELFFYLYFTVIFGMRMWGIYEGTKLYGYCLVMGGLFWGLSVLMTEHTVLEYMSMLSLLAVAGIVYLNSGEKGLLLYFTLMLGMKRIDVERVFKVGVIVGGLGMACMAFLTSFGFIDDVIYLQSRPHFGMVFRHALGMPHPNTLGTSFFIIIVMVMYIIGYEDRSRIWIVSLLLLIISLYIYIYSVSRTGIIVSVGFLLLNLLYSYRKQIGAFERAICFIMFPIIWGISIILPAVSSDELNNRLAKIDGTLMNRIHYGKGYFHYNSVTMFGSRVTNPDTVYGIDISQLYLFLNLGIVAFVILTTLYVALVIYELKNNMVKEMLSTMIFLVMGLADPFLYNISFKNITFVFMGVMYYRFMSIVSERHPTLSKLRLQPLAFGSTVFRMKGNQILSYMTIGLKKIPKRKRILAIVIPIITSVIVSVAIYCVTPDPEFAMTDRNIGEHRLLKGLKGRTYTEKEIHEIKSQGNIVLNYTDDNELMYIYYSDENRAIDGGYYADKAALIEKTRWCISFFLWGTLVLSSICFSAGLWQYAITDHNERGVYE